VCAVFCAQLLLPLAKCCVRVIWLLTCTGRPVANKVCKKKTILLFLVLTINFCGGCVLDHICSCYEWIRYSFDFAMTVLLLDKFDLVQ